MKSRLVMAALALSLLGGTSALAQHDEHDHAGGPPPGGGHPSPGAPHAPPTGGGAPHGPPAGAAAPQHGPIAPLGAQHVQSGPAGGNHGPIGQGGGRPGYQAAPPSNHGGRPGPGGAGARPQYDRRQFPSVIHSDQRYHWRGPAWSAPQGYYYRHWGYGDRLPFGWFGPQWYINDYYDYGLPPAPYGYEWVRVGPDALLIDLDTGMVVEADYGIFY